MSEITLKLRNTKSITAKSIIGGDDDFGVEFLFIRDDDISGMIENGVCDIGILGKNLLDEYYLKSSNLKRIS